MESESPPPCSSPEPPLQTLRYNRKRSLSSPCNPGASNVDSGSPLPPEPLLRILPRQPGKDYCDVCDGSWKNYKGRVKVICVDKEAFKTAALKWEQSDHRYNKVYKKIDWSRDEKTSVCKTCHSGFFYKDKPDQKLPDTSLPSVSSPPPVAPAPQQPTPVRKSSRQRCTFETKRDIEEEKNCIICNSIKKDKKGRIIPVVLISLRPKERNKPHIAEDTLLKFAKIHIEHGTKYKDAGERIQLVSATTSLFAADVGYHMDECYIPYRNPYFEKLGNPTIRSTPQQNVPSVDSFRSLCDLVRLHVVYRKEVYTLADLRSAYETLKTDNCPTLRVGDIKSRLAEEFQSELCIGSSVHSPKNQEYVFPASSSLTPDVLEATASGHGLCKTAVFRSAASRLHHEIVKNQTKRNWPPTPQDIIEDKNPFNPDTFNYIAWIIEPDAPVGDNGLAKMSSKRKVKKIMQICRNIESLMPNGQPSLDQVLFSLILHRKTGAREPVDLAAAFGYGIPFTETCFCEDKWAEWDKEQNSNIPANIRKNVLTTIVADNIDWKNKDISGSETHHTNVILIQHTGEVSGCKASLKPNYDFDRKRHRSFKTDSSELPVFHCKKVNPKKFTFQNSESMKTEGIEFVQASQKTISWLLCRRGNIPNDLVPAWSAFQTMTTKKPALCEVNVGYRRAIRDTPTKFGTIKKILTTTDEIMKELELGFIYLEVDQAIYTKVMDVKFYLSQIHTHDPFKNIIVRMGGFHVIICLIRSIFSRFRGFGFTELLSQVGGLGGPGTIEKNLSGGDIKAGTRLYKLLFEALYRIKFKYLEKVAIIPEDENASSFLTLLQEVRSSLDFDGIQKLIQHPQIQYYQSAVDGDMARWIDSFLEMVDLLLNIVHFQRTGNWNGFLETLYKFLPYCFAINRKNYARNLSFYYLDMIDLEQRNKDAYEYLRNGGFTGSLTGSLHSNIPMDQIIETTINRFSKSTGGMSGKTEDQGACEKWVRLNPYLCALKEHMDRKIHKNRKVTHIELGDRRKKKDEADVVAIVATLEAWVPDLYSKDKPLINISNGAPASQELISNSKSLKSRGEAARDSFFSRIAILENCNDDCDNLKYNDAIKKQTLITFADKSKDKKTYSIPEDEGQSFADIISRYDQKILDFEFLCAYPITSRPWSICNEEEKGRSNSKSLFRNSLQQLSPIKAVNIGEEQNIHTYVVDAMKIVRMIPVSNLKPPTFLTWAEKWMNYIKNLQGKAIHIVFDLYSEEVDLTRPSKGRYSSIGEKKHVSSLTQIIPTTKKDWQDFLSNDSNKYQLINLLTEYILSDACVVSCPIYVTKRDTCILKSINGSLADVSELSCTHKEADPRLALHAVHASSLAPGESVAVVCDDTDVFVILLSVAVNMQGTLYFRQGNANVGKGIEFHNVTSLAHFLGDLCCRNLPAFHALTGSDFTYPFYRRSKFQAFSMMMNLKKAKKRQVSVHLLNTLGTEHVNYNEIIDFILHTVYNRPMKEKSPKDSRLAMLFTAKGKNRKFRSTKLLPADQSSLIMKLKRSNLVSYPWKNCLNTSLVPMDPKNCGWDVIGDMLVPVWFEGGTLPTDEEYDAHIERKQCETTEDEEMCETDSDNSESDYDSDEYATSEAYSSSDEDDD